MDSRLMTLKAKKIGLFLRQARENRHLSTADCAQWLGMKNEQYQEVEGGSALLSLPQLESLSYYLDCSFRSLTTEDPVLLSGDKTDASTNQEILALRDRIIAVALKHHRLAGQFSIEDLAGATGISAQELTEYEENHTAIPYLHLETLLKALNLSSDEFFAQSGPLSLQHEKEAAQPEPTPGVPEPTPASPMIEGLPAEMLDFVSKPVNRPYIELAMRLSQMEADKLRAIASSLLEITY